MGGREASAGRGRVISCSLLVGRGRASVVRHASRKEETSWPLVQPSGKSVQKTFVASLL